MKHVARLSALFLIFASAMLADSSAKANVTAAHSVSRAAFVSGPVPTCDPNNPRCTVDNVR
jgi:hypothetical protein